MRYFAFLRELAGKGEETVHLSENAYMEDLLNELSSKYGEEFRNYVYRLGRFKGLTLNLLLNGREVSTIGGLKARLKDGDTVSILPPVGGG